MVATNLIRFCGFVLYSKFNVMTQSGIPEKIPEIEKKYIVFHFLCDNYPTYHLKQLTNLVQIRYLEFSSRYMEVLFFVFDEPLKLRVVPIRKIKISIITK